MKQPSTGLVSSAPLVEGAVIAAVEASIGSSLQNVAEAANSASAMPKFHEPRGGNEMAGRKDDRMSNATTSVTITNRVGLHARPARLVVQMAAPFQARIQLTCGNKSASARSILNVLKPGARQGDMLIIPAEGGDAEQALQALLALIHRNFDEEA